MKQHFRTILLAAGAVTAITGNRIFPNRRPQDVRDASVVLMEVDRVPGYSMTGPANYDEGVVQIELFARDQEALETLRAAVQAALEAFTGAVNGISIGWIEFDDAGSDNNEPTGEGRGAVTEHSLIMQARYLRI